jgi:predicted DNA-binding ribbon-helix-helix protein
MSAVKKRSVSLRGHRTSYSLEDAFFDILAEQAKTQRISLAALISRIDEARARGTNLSSALRLAALDWVRSGSGKVPTEPARGQ